MSTRYTAFPEKCTLNRHAAKAAIVVSKVQVQVQVKADLDIQISKKHRFELAIGNDLLALPESHELSIQLCNQFSSSSSFTEGISISMLSPGLLEVSISPPVDYPYAGRVWRFRVGGGGTGVDFTFDRSDDFNMLPERTPVAIRAAVPMSHVYCDDSGIVVSLDFWGPFSGFCKKTEGLALTIENIASRLLEMLKGPFDQSSKEVGRVLLTGMAEPVRLVTLCTDRR